jgi:long-chain acyl-CoA synthetase
MRAGLLAIPVNPGFTERELRHVLTDSGADLVIDLDHPLSLDGQPAAELPEVGDDSVALLLYTSGTEGAPKGAMLTHRALIANHVQLAAIEPAIVDSDDTVLLALPMFHAYGLNTGLGAVAFHGACGVLAERFDAEESLRLIAQEGVTVVVGVPSMYTLWAGHLTSAAPVATVRVAVCGAAPLEAVTARRFAAVTGVSVNIGYGLTETAPVVSSTLVSPAP